MTTTLAETSCRRINYPTDVNTISTVQHITNLQAANFRVTRAWQLPARLFKLMGLLRALGRWQHPRRDRKERQLLLGFLFLRQLLRQ